MGKAEYRSKDSGFNWRDIRSCMFFPLNPNGLRHLQNTGSLVCQLTGEGSQPLHWYLIIKAYLTTKKELKE